MTGLDLSPFLNMGLTSANFHAVGNLPAFKVLSSNIFNGSANSEANSLRIFGWRLSGPGDLVQFNEDKAFLISSVVILISVIVWSVFVGKSGILFLSSIVNTELKKCV